MPGATTSPPTYLPWALITIAYREPELGPDDNPMIPEKV